MYTHIHFLSLLCIHRNTIYLPVSLPTYLLITPIQTGTYTLLYIHRNTIYLHVSLPTYLLKTPTQTGTYTLLYIQRNKHKRTNTNLRGKRFPSSNKPSLEEAIPAALLSNFLASLTRWREQKKLKGVTKRCSLEVMRMK